MGNATLCARVIVDELIGRGVRDVVLAPGSRSAPLAYEFYEADRIGLVRLHVRIDERDAGFLALGLAKASGLPVPVLTTSGSAPAHLHPAVLEAWHAHVPLLVLTADRPRAMTQAGANQTTDQAHLYARHTRAYAGLSDAAAEPRTWRFELARIWAAATGIRTRTPGPVQVNVEFSPPLAPTEIALPTVRASVELSPGPPPTPTELPAGPQTVLVAGDAPPEQGQAMAAAAAAAGVPVLAEPSSNARIGPTALSTYRLLLDAPLAEEIERVVLVGRPTLSRPVQALLARDDVELVVVSPHADWVDPGRVAATVTDAVTFGAAAPATEGGSDWLDAWRRADLELRGRLDALLDAQPELTGPGLARALWRVLTSADTLYAGSSNPIRDLDLAPISDAPPTVYANRGLSGIDGAVSTAMGIALIAERPTHALLGDLTLLHDAGGLVLGPHEPRPDLRVVVANDDGGSIFATLEQGRPEHRRAFERIFGTPHGVDLRALAGATRTGYQRVTSTEELTALLEEPPLGVELVEAVVDRAQRRTLHTAITELATTL